MPNPETAQQSKARHQEMQRFFSGILRAYYGEEPSVNYTLAVCMERLIRLMEVHPEIDSFEALARHTERFQDMPEVRRLLTLADCLEKRFTEIKALARDIKRHAGRL